MTDLRSGSLQQIEIWHLQVPEDLKFHSTQRFQKLLRPSEIFQIDSFLSDTQKIQFVLSRALLRNRLAFYLGRNPQSFEWTTNLHGRPQFDPHSENANIHFNLSHAEGCISCAFGPDSEIGIDVECTRRDIDILKMSEEIFSPSEASFFQNKIPTEQRDIFFKIWTLKEAYLKAIGVGIIDQLKEISFHLDPNKGLASLITCDLNLDSGKNWKFYLSRPTSNHQLALAHRSPAKMEQKVQEFFISIDDFR